MSCLHQSKQLDLVDTFIDTSRYLTVDNPEFEHISDIYPAELQLNKANACQKETALLLAIFTR